MSYPLRLTPRQQEVDGFLRQGHSLERIAGMLGVDREAVRKHRKAIQDTAETRAMLAEIREGCIRRVFGRARVETWTPWKD
jgi:DNA-binding CsgD family transcriptional regulator